MLKNNKGYCYENHVKRKMDFVLSLITIIFLSPIFLIIAISIRIKLGSPVIFKQRRPGLNEKIFTMYKFRTMSDKKDVTGALLQDSERITKFGLILRSSSLDELPELFNIVKGDMSLVGPRPLLVSYLQLYSEEQKVRHHVRPGLTGFAQVNGRNMLDWEEKFELDREYVKNVKFSTDFKIILKTIKKVLIKEGINSHNSVTMKPFKGDKSS